MKEALASERRVLLDAGFTAESIDAAIRAGDVTMLKHSGLFSVRVESGRP